MTSKVLRKELFEVSDENGFVFCGKFIPVELLTIILSYLEPKDLVFGCRRVCKTWCNLVDSEIWKIKIHRSYYNIQKWPELPWFGYYWILAKNLLDKNLLKNGCGQEGFKHWNIINYWNETINNWKVEKPPLGCRDFPAHAEEEIIANNSCFVTSNHFCAKEQVIKLSTLGATTEFMDIIRPDIVVSEWIAGREDCPGEYKINVALLDENQTIVPDFSPNQVRTQFRLVQKVGGEHGCSWHKIAHVFEDYEPGVRFIKFQHRGRDLQAWDGHYGCKMTGASVIFCLGRNKV